MYMYMYSILGYVFFFGGPFEGSISLLKMAAPDGRNKRHSVS